MARFSHFNLAEEDRRLLHAHLYHNRTKRKDKGVPPPIGHFDLFSVGDFILIVVKEDSGPPMFVANEDDGGVFVAAGGV